MKLAVITCLFLILVSCTDANVIVIQIQESIKSEALWRQPLGNSPTEGALKVIFEPKNSTRSEIVVDSITGGLSYVYLSEPDFTGTEFIIIDRAESIGDAHYQSTEFRIELTVLPR